MQSKNRLLLVQVLGCLLLLASFIGGPRLVIGASPRVGGIIALFGPYSH